MDKKEIPSFEEVAVKILENVQADREHLLEVISAMKKVMEEHSEAAIPMCETIVRAHDVLNKMTQQLAGVGSLLLKDKLKAEPNDDLRKDLWDEMSAQNPFEDKDPKEN